MADVWFYAQNGHQTGPVSAEQLQELAHAGRLRESDLVWKEGLPQWVQAKSVTGLFPQPVDAGLVTDSFLQKAAVPPAWAGIEPEQAPGGAALDAEPVDEAPARRSAPTGWEALPGGAKAGILVGGVALLVMAVAIPVMIYNSSFGPDDGDKTINGQLTLWDRPDRARGGSRAQYHNYRMKAGTVYTIRMLSNRFDTYLRLEDPSGNNVAEDDDGDAPGSLNAKIVYTAPKDGTYRIVATSFAPMQMGEYQLVITRALAAPTAPAGKADAVPTFQDDGTKTFSGQLTRFDPPNRFRQNARERSYTYRMRAGTVYTIRMAANSPGFDPYLRLENPFGQVVAEDDDGDGYPNARITYVCPQDGSYRIVATSFGGTLGNYTVSVTPNR